MGQHGKPGVRWPLLAIGAGLLAYGMFDLLAERNRTGTGGKHSGSILARPLEQTRAAAHRGAPTQSQTLGAPRNWTQSPSLDAEPVMLSLVAPASARVGQHVVIAINVESTSVAMKAITVRLGYDRARVRLVSMIAGDVMMQGGADSEFGYEEARDDGEVRAVLSAIDSGGVTGAGSAATAEFEAIAEGPAVVSVREFQASDAAGVVASAARAASSASVLIGP
jgi:hypothetical protein